LVTRRYSPLRDFRGLSAFYGKVDSDEERFKVLDRAYELGETHWDSKLLHSPCTYKKLITNPAGADIYGDSEELLGKWFKRTGKREEIFLTTKFANKVLGGGGAKREIDSSPEYCKEACEKSLKRLGTDYIDLYYW
jgi:aryl-alcohol dehydrogenase-like predicted oxidoreductase